MAELLGRLSCGYPQVLLGLLSWGHRRVPGDLRLLPVQQQSPVPVERLQLPGPGLSPALADRFLHFPA